MKYYVSLIIIFFSLCFIELFFALIFPVFNFSFILTFLLTVAFFVPTKTRYYYRSILPIVIVCGLAVDGMSTLPTGTIFITYLLVSLLVLNVAKNLPQGEDLRAFVVVVFLAVFLLQVILSFVFNHFNFFVVRKDIFSAFFSATFSSVIGLFLAYLLETKKGSAFVKILFFEE